MNKCITYRLASIKKWSGENNNKKKVSEKGNSLSIKCRAKD